jgi:hypothetical protein
MMMSSEMKIDRPSAVDGSVGSKGGRSPSATFTGRALPALTATPAAAQPPRPALSPLYPRTCRSALREFQFLAPFRAPVTAYPTRLPEDDRRREAQVFRAFAHGP